MTSLLARVALVCVALAAAACSPSLSSPPGRGLHYLSPAAAGRGEVEAMAAVAFGGEVFGPDVVAVDARVRVGVAERVDVGVSASAAVVLGEALARSPHRGVYASRAFGHFELAPGILAIDVGLGGGGSAAGGYVSPDLGLTLGYENPYAVPYAHGSVLMSAPVTKRALDVRLVDDEEPDLRSPFLTVGTLFGAGVRIPVGPRAARLGSVYVEVSGIVLAGDDPFDGPDDQGSEIERGLVLVGACYEGRFRTRSD